MIDVGTKKITRSLINKRVIGNFTILTPFVNLSSFLPSWRNVKKQLFLIKHERTPSISKYVIFSRNLFNVVREGVSSIYKVGPNNFQSSCV